MADYHAGRVRTLSARLEAVGQRYRFSMRDLTGDELYGFWIMQTTIKVLQSLIETIIGHPAGDNVEISFDYPKPDYSAVLESIYATACRYDAAETAISIPASWQHIPSPLYDEGTYRSSIAKCRQIIARQSGARDPATQVRNLLASHFDEVLANSEQATRPPSLEQIAGQLHITPRTLIRRLKRADTSYKALLEELRFDCAATLLQQAHNTVADVGHRLGYRDPANFGRAFRSWTGTTPAAWRRSRGQVFDL
jgi:AraC-like DNA-binding protein